ncbi:MAG TPA: glycoside hydrolase family 3 C-terminal domain-containing protein [Streptosporangiaceae bacterium]|nr:glycoside hydrolase family 3 C-terminal domain-containing protein [Streptosporangiaceae bacterium]
MSDLTAQEAVRAEQEAVVEAALGQLGLEAKVAILSGQDTWTLPALPEIGLASIVMSDGPVGVRGVTWSAADPSVALPSPTALAATWDSELARQAGQLLGQEARRKGVHVLLAPTVNLHRSPLGGRHFECYSEDPLLTGEIGTGYVAGVQDQGVATTVKHFIGNDFETERFTASTVVSDRALRELYLAPFETIISKAAAWGVMSAYNAVNGVSMTQHAALQRGVLKGEWDFDGVIVSDWLAARATAATANGGLDVAMPAAGNPWGARLVAAVQAGEVPIGVIDEQVRRVLRLAARVGALAGAPETVPPERRPVPVNGASIAREVAARSFVLAVNRDGMLPLDVSGLGSIALIGALARDARVLGGGSATVFPAHIVSPLEGLSAALPDAVKLSYAIGSDPRTGKLTPAAAPHWTGLQATFRDTAGAIAYQTPLATGAGRWMEMPAGVDPDTLDTVQISGQLTAEASGTHQLGIRGIGRFTLSAGDAVLFDGLLQPESDDLAVTFLAPPERRVPVAMTAGETLEVALTYQVSLIGGFRVVSLTLGYGAPIAAADDLLTEAEAVASAADVAVVVVGTTDEVESEGFDRTTLALPGRQDELVRRVAAVNRRTIVVVNAGSPVELPWADQVAAVLLVWFPGQEAGHAIADVLLGAAEPGGRLPTTWPLAAADSPVLSVTPVDGELRYDEGVFIGYRAYERAGITPRFSFGHGLSYTSWEYEQLAADGREVTVSVRNTGSRAGREVVQVYAGPVMPDNERPRRWLAGFATVTADPGETATVTITLPERSFQIWADGWTTVPGDYLIEVAHSLDDVRGTATIAVA